MKYIRHFMRNKKVIFSVVYSILISLLYVVIFVLSAQDGDTSGGLSMKISGKCTEILESLSGEEWDNQKETEVAQGIELPLRKMAHFTEYACMGVLIYLLLRLWISKRKVLYVIPIVWVFISAALDEFHQSFVPGRYAGFSDVCVDTLGGIAGLLFIIWSSKIFQRKHS